jgi:uncharacterized OB-fold protein
VTAQPHTVRPVTDDLDTGEFFAAAGRGALVVCECATCGRVLHMPRRWCHHCAAGEVRWREVRPAGTVYSFSVVAHQIHPDFPVPYTVVLIDLDDAPGTRLVGRIEGRPPLAIGDAVNARFIPFSDGTALPEWRVGTHPDV